MRSFVVPRPATELKSKTPEVLIRQTNTPSIVACGDPRKETHITHHALLLTLTSNYCKALEPESGELPRLVQANSTRSAVRRLLIGATIGVVSIVLPTTISKSTIKRVWSYDVLVEQNVGEDDHDQCPTLPQPNDQRSLRLVPAKGASGEMRTRQLAGHRHYHQQ